MIGRVLATGVLGLAEDLVEHGCVQGHQPSQEKFHEGDSLSGSGPTLVLPTLGSAGLDV